MKKLILSFIFISLMLLSSCTKAPGKYDVFAKCIVDSGAKMYGTWWCPHCNAQKEEFGTSWDIMKNEGGYVECANQDKSQTEPCIQAKISNYPTWRFADGSDLLGKQDFYTLSTKTGCQI